MTLQDLITRLISPQEANDILELKIEDIEAIELGELANFDTHTVIRFFEVWCSRIDKIIEIDKELNKGIPTWRSHSANRWRGYTYLEYQDLFNIHIEAEQFSHYPIFSQLRKQKGGINTAKQRANFTSKLDCNEESYLTSLCENSFEPLLNAFFSQFAKLSALLPLDKLKRHTYLCSPTGTGKSELMRVLFHRMVKKYPKFSFILIDPHGSLAADCKKLKSVGGDPDRLVYIEPFLKDGHTPTFNPFEMKDTSLQNLTFTAEQIISAIEETLSREGGKLTEVQVNMLEKSVYFLLRKGNATILDLVDLLNAKEGIFEQAQQHDPDFFNAYFRKPNNRKREALVNRIERLLNSPVLRNLLGGQSTFDIDHIINGGKILIVNLGDVSEMSQVMIGKFLVACIKSVIRKRKKNTGRPCFLFVDEVQSMISGSFDYILSQLRGFGLHLVMANQYLSQLGDQAESVTKNSAIKIVGGEDYDDMKAVVKVPKDQRLKDYEFFLKVRGYHIRSFASPDVIIKHPKRYEIGKDAEKRLDKLQTERYYRAYDQQEVNTRKPHTTKPTEAKKEDKKSNGSPIPPFDIFIKE